MTFTIFVLCMVILAVWSYFTPENEVPDPINPNPKSPKNPSKKEKK